LRTHYLENKRLDWLTLLGLAVGLAMDAFAVSIAAGLSIPQVTLRHTFRLAFHFGLFQALMPILGYLAGRQAMVWIADYDHWVAFGLLGAIGGKMLLDAARGPKSTQPDASDPSRGIALVGLSVATSLDALAVGLSMALLRVSVWLPAVVIGLVAAGLSAVGVTFGARLGSRFGRLAELAGGCVLVAIGVRILIAHLGA